MPTDQLNVPVANAASQATRSAMTRSETHMPVLDGVRGLAISMVLVFHFWQMSTTPLPESARHLFRLFSIGQKGVDLFFVLSGFLITGILLRTKGSLHYFKNFYARRALRIFPLYYGVLLVCLLCGKLLSVGNLKWGSIWWYFGYLQNLATTFWPGWIGGPGHFWSLAVEEHFYLFWPLVVLVLNRRRLVICSIGLIVAAALFRMWFIFRGIDVFTFTACRMDTLALGALLAIIFTSNSYWSQISLWTRRLVLPMSLVAFSSFFLLSGKGSFAVQALKYLLFAVLCAFVLVLALSPGKNNPLPQLFSNRLLRHLGKTSYGMYVFHPFIYGTVVGQLYQLSWSPLKGLVWPSMAVEFLIAVSMTILASQLSWVAFERPFLSLKSRFRYDSVTTARSSLSAPCTYQ